MEVNFINTDILDKKISACAMKVAKARKSLIELNVGKLNLILFTRKIRKTFLNI